MIRSLLIYLSQADWARRLVMSFPLARRTALRFVAGERLDVALKVVRELNELGMLVTLDLLGEHTADLKAARQATQRICDAIEQVSKTGLRASFSVKLTQIGLKLDEGQCQTNLIRVLGWAAERKIFVRVDMEESTVLEATLRVIRGAREAGHSNVGAVIQSYLYRSADDVAKLLAEDVPIRLVKGAYKEPSEIAYPKKADADAAFDLLTEAMLEASKEWEPQGQPDTWPPLAAVATHDEERVRFANKLAAELGVVKERLEFQMLYGIRRELQQELYEAGYPVRVYVPFGEQWYPYFMRRLAERPANLWFFLSNLARR